MSDIGRQKIDDFPGRRKAAHDRDEYVRRDFVPRGQSEHMLVSACEAPPRKSADPLFFPADSEGAHRLTNASDTEKLVSIDFDVIHDLDVAVYPDSNKIGIWGNGVNRVCHQDDNVDYYEGE